VASPVRAAVIDALEVIAPATIVQAATAFGYPPDGLYYHLRVLKRMGLVVRTMPEKDTGAARFDLPGRPATLRYHLAGTDGGQSSCDDGEMRGTQFSTRVCPGCANVKGPHRNLRAGRRIAWLTDSELWALNRYVERIHALFARGRPQRTGARLHEFTYVLAPMVENGRRARAGSIGEGVRS
jgi:DNA-binding transcriptional ArsR family regulator